jgi:Flp pilus assembly protein TadD
MDQYEKALDIRPGLEQVHNNLGVILANRGHIGEAVDHFRKAVEIKPAFGDANRNLGELLAAREQFDEAISYFDKALTIMPADGRAIEDFRRAWDDRGATWKLLVRQRQLLRAHPKDITLLNNIAWKLATNPNASIRDGMEAIRLAQRAVELSGGREPAVLGTLAAACAEADQFSDALKVARRAAELAKRQNKPALARSIQSKIRLYEASTPFREMREIALPRSTQP